MTAYNPAAPPVASSRKRLKNRLRLIRFATKRKCERCLAVLEYPSPLSPCSPCGPTSLPENDTQPSTKRCHKKKQKLKSRNWHSVCTGPRTARLSDLARHRQGPNEVAVSRNTQVIYCLTEAQAMAVQGLASDLSEREVTCAR